jgi:hypothetical protein
MDGSSNATVVRIGDKSTHRFSLVPKIQLVPDQPGNTLKQDIAKPSGLNVFFPIEGRQTNLPGPIPCLFWWVVRTGAGQEQQVGPASASVNRKGDRFEILIGGKTPTLSLIGEKLFGNPRRCGSSSSSPPPVPRTSSLGG